MRQSIDTNTALKIYEALIQPHFDYCSTVWDDLSITLNDKLQKLQNRAARTITKSPYNASTSELFSKLGWDDLLTRRKKHKAIMMFKTVDDLTPSYLHGLFDFRSTGYNLRNLENILFVPKPRTNYMVKELLVMTGQSCGMNCLKGYEPYALLLNLKEKFITCSLYDTQTPARQFCKTVCSMYIILKNSIVLLYKS